MKKNTLIYLILIVLVAVLIVVNICQGSVNVSLSDILTILKTGDSESTMGKIIMQIRLPRIVEAAFLGGALALSGYLLQAFFQNPIAGPYILGISSGAKLLVAILMVFSLNMGFMMKSWMMIVVAFIGSMIATGFVLLVSFKVRSMSILVVCGVMVGYICSAITELIVAFADDSNIVNLHNWSQGTFSAASWNNTCYYIPIVVICLIISVFMSKSIEAYMFGETYAATLGIDIKRFRFALIVVSSILSATVTAFAGPISFVGIAMPHIARIIFKSEKPKTIIPAACLLGVIFALLSDLIARSMFSPTELSISTVTAIFGAPIVISMMVRSRRGSNG